LHVAILGNGIAGVSAAIRLRQQRPEWRITIVSGESTHHWSRPALMYVFMGHMRYADTKPYQDGFWKEQRIELVRDWVTEIDVEAKRLVLHRGAPLEWDKLLLATGSKPNRFGWPGQDLGGVHGMYGLQDLRELTESCARASRAVVVGGGLIGIELAEMLHSRRLHVTMLVRESGYWGNVLPPDESRLVGRVIREAGIDLRLETNLARILDDGRGRAAGVETEDGERIDCQLVGLTAGVSPNLDVVRGTPIESRRGVLVDASLRTSAPDVLAAGDCAEIRGPSGADTLLQQVWYTGRMQGEVAGDVLAGIERSYEPGIWFNSAKFLDLEFQTYGRVDASGESSVYWEDERERRALRIAHEGDVVVGFNALGLRLRHRVCERWIAERRSPAHVLEHLSEAGFDPEFTRRFEQRATSSLRSQLA
jgi:NAD(P)H-nitrite reductase large subunit